MLIPYSETTYIDDPLIKPLINVKKQLIILTGVSLLVIRFILFNRRTSVVFVDMSPLKNIEIGSIQYFCIAILFDIHGQFPKLYGEIKW